MSIEVIVLESFSTLPNSGINLSTKPCPLNAVFHFLSDYSKQDAAVTNPHRNHFIGILKEIKYWRCH